MSPKRRNFQARSKQSALVNRLGRNQRRDPFHSRGWLQVDSSRIHGFDGAWVRKMVFTWAFMVALLLGWTIGPPMFDYWQADGDAVRVRSIAVQGTERVPAATVAAATGVELDAPMRGIDTNAVAAQVASHPMVRSARVTALPYGQLVVRVEEREPHALLRGPATQAGEAQWWLVDESGTPFAHTRVDAWSRLPRLHSDEPVESDAASEPLRVGVELASAMRDTRFDALKHREIEVPGATSGDGWVIHTRGNPRRVLLGSEAVGPRLERLAMLLEARLPEARTASEIDLRFAGQAVLRNGPASK